MMNKKEIESMIKDYHWMINTVQMMHDSLGAAGERLAAQYGVEASLPKAKGTISDPIYREYLRREKRWKKLNEYKMKIEAIQECTLLIEAERELEVLHWLLEGKNYSWIARHMGLSERHIRRLKDAIVEQMSKMPNLPKTTGKSRTSEKCMC